MNWKIILQLSIFGLIMAIGTVSLIPQNIEWMFWLPIFIFCAFVIAKVCPDKYFLYGFLVCLVNCFWIIVVHVLFYKSYIPTHISMFTSMPLPLGNHPRWVMIISGPIFGILSGIVLGLFSIIASKIVKKN